jgi:hypothetical protein
VDLFVLEPVVDSDGAGHFQFEAVLDDSGEDTGLAHGRIADDAGLDFFNH